MEENQIEPVKQEEKRNPDGTFIKGVSGNPAGRPKGQSLKEFWRQRFQEMTEEEKIAFSNKVGNDTLWKMAEGNPKNDLDLNAKVTIADVIKDIENGNKIIGQVVEIAEPLQDTGQEEKPEHLPPQQSPSPLPSPQVVEKYNPQEPPAGLHD